jgi:hypothetical protein
MDELDSTVGGPPVTCDVVAVVAVVGVIPKKEVPPLEKDPPLGNSTRMASFPRTSRVGGEAGGVSLNEGEPESMLALEGDDPLLLRPLEASRPSDPLIIFIYAKLFHML